MQNPPERNESEIHIIHNGKFYFSIFEGRRPSWCDLKILQGKNNSSLVILSQPQGYIGTVIAIAAEDIATQVTNLFGLDPALTTFIHYMPPTVDKWPQDLAEDDPIAEFVRYLHGPSDENFDHVTFQWMETDTDEPVLERYYVQGDPHWKRIHPGDAAKLLEELNRR